MNREELVNLVEDFVKRESAAHHDCINGYDINVKADGTVACVDIELTESHVYSIDLLNRWKYCLGSYRCYVTKNWNGYLLLQFLIGENYDKKRDK